MCLSRLIRRALVPFVAAVARAWSPGGVVGTPGPAVCASRYWGKWYLQFVAVALRGWCRRARGYPLGSSFPGIPCRRRLHVWPVSPRCRATSFSPRPAHAPPDATSDSLDGQPPQIPRQDHNIILISYDTLPTPFWRGGFDAAAGTRVGEQQLDCCARVITRDVR